LDDRRRVFLSPRCDAEVPGPEIVLREEIAAQAQHNAPLAFLVKTPKCPRYMKKMRNRDTESGKFF
jgi:hypothetical protein